MKLLLISYSFPPLQNARAFRWGPIANELARRGHDVDVVCGATEAAPDSVGAATHQRVKCFRVRSALLARAQQAWHARQTPPDAATNSLPRPPGGDRPRRAWTGAALHGLKRWGWDRVRFPDAYAHFLFPAWRQAKELLRQRRYDALATVSFPFTDHLVGLWIKRRIPRLRWVADIGDPFSLVPEVNNRRLYGLLNRRLERQVLQTADCVSLTTAALRREYERHLGVDGSPYRVIPPLLSAAAAPALARPNAGKRLVFLGQLYRDIRNPRRMFELFSALAADSELQDWSLHVYGDTTQVDDVVREFQLRLGERLAVHGPVPRDVASAGMADADVLLNIGNATSFQLPSKLIDYVASGRPILNLSGNTKDCGRDFLAEHPATLHLPPGPLGAAQTEEAAAFLKSAKSVAPEHVARLCQPYTLNAIVDQYMEALTVQRVAARGGRAA